MKYYKAIFTIDKDYLRHAYASGHNIEENDCPPLEDMIQTELKWIRDSGIKLINIEPQQEFNLVRENNEINIIWSIHDVRQVAQKRQLSLDDQTCRLILESIENNYNAKIGVNYDTINFAIDSYLDI